MLYIQFTVFINFAHPGNECPFWDFVWSGVTMICQQWNTTQTCCCCCPVAQSCPTLYNPVECRTPGFPVTHHLPQFAQIHVHWIGDSIQPSHPLSSPSPPAFSHFHTVHGVLKARMLKWFTVPFLWEYWNGLLCPSPGDLLNPGIKPKSLALQADSLLSETPGKPTNTGVGGLSLLQGLFLTQESNQGLLSCRRILYQLSYQLVPFKHRTLLWREVFWTAKWKCAVNTWII